VFPNINILSNSVLRWQEEGTAFANTHCVHISKIRESHIHQAKLYPLFIRQ